MEKIRLHPDNVDVAAIIKLNNGVAFKNAIKIIATKTRYTKLV